jgi:hypothetical protein
MGRTNIEYQCCFWGQTVESLGPDVSGLLYTTNINDSQEKQHDQQLWCHANCLKQRLHSSVPLYVLDLAEDERRGG